MIHSTLLYAPRPSQESGSEDGDGGGSSSSSSAGEPRESASSKDGAQRQMGRAPTLPNSCSKRSHD